MKILVDENIPRRTVDWIRQAGHDVCDIRESPIRGIDDDTVWKPAQREQRLWVTTDKGFAGRRMEPRHGIFVVRLREPNRQRIHERVMRAMQQLQEGDWPGLLVVMRDVAQHTWRR
jgi:predicted nuclease of predicted toxin-antitoxin system